ncbi:MAG TPA: Spo0E family sporulation regulatory protein-aspartic acid phosphatase [Firmicutes bacterium]|nr:Spo0E family sporulation regulatory protein-aspartic acid phosphatase [Bacillota bacterium]HHY97741.1 Spo0E family sporulation regulatory protein-aspartic acid phosphatase [Bacillota bacterium]
MRASADELLQDIDGRLNSLKVRIEALRQELYLSIQEDGGRFDGDRTRHVSSQLDSLVIQYLRVREKLEECERVNPRRHAYGGRHNEDK